MEEVTEVTIATVMDLDLRSKKRRPKIMLIIMVALLAILGIIPMKNPLLINTKTPRKILKILLTINLKKKRGNTNNQLILRNPSKK